MYLIDGVPSDEIDFRQIYLDNADCITLLKDGECEEMHRRENSENSGEDHEDGALSF